MTNRLWFLPSNTVQFTGGIAIVVKTSPEQMSSTLLAALGNGIYEVAAERGGAVGSAEKAKDAVEMAGFDEAIDREALARLLRPQQS